MKITISGMPGAGKTVVAQLLADQYKFKCYLIGNMRRKMAKDLGISLQELNDLGETQSFTDEDVDNYTRDIGSNEDNIIVEGRVAFHFVEDSLKIFLDVSSDIGAQRIFSENKRWDEGYFATLDEAKQTIRRRIKSDRERYKKYYGIDYTDRSNYDIVIDTTDKSIEQVCSELDTAIKAKSL